MDHGHASAGPEQFQSSDRRGILRSNDQNVLVVVRMGLAIVMNDLVEVLTRDTQLVRDVVVAACQDDLLCPVSMSLRVDRFGADLKVAIGALEPEDTFILMNVELVVVRHAPVVLQSLRTTRLLIQR